MPRSLSPYGMRPRVFSYNLFPAQTQPGPSRVRGGRNCWFRVLSGELVMPRACSIKYAAPQPGIEVEYVEPAWQSGQRIWLRLSLLLTAWSQGAKYIIWMSVSSNVSKRWMIKPLPSPLRIRWVHICESTSPMIKHHINKNNIHLRNAYYVPRLS